MVGHSDWIQENQLEENLQGCAKSCDLYEKQITFFTENEVLSCY